MTNAQAKLLVRIAEAWCPKAGAEEIKAVEAEIAENESEATSDTFQAFTASRAQRKAEDWAIRHEFEKVEKRLQKLEDDPIKASSVRRLRNVLESMADEIRALKLPESFPQWRRAVDVSLEEIEEKIADQKKLFEAWKSSFLHIGAEGGAKTKERFEHLEKKWANLSHDVHTHAEMLEAQGCEALKEEGILEKLRRLQTQVDVFTKDMADVRKAYHERLVRLEEARAGEEDQ